MAPGPRKKNFNRRTVENQQDNKKTSKSNIEPQTEDKGAQSASVNEVEADCLQDKKYSKRTLASNWTKYDEPVSEPHADSLRGKDFEVLLSYSGGFSSQLQLQDEKDWDEVCVSDKSITLDLQDLACVLKSIPFHKRINLSEDIFDDSQLKKFTSYAEKWKLSYTSNAEVSMPAVQEEVIIKSETIDSSLNIIESYESDYVSDVITKPLILEEKTENIIESLASCLSLKASIPDKIAESEVKNSENTTDDLDFLLSLSMSKNPKQEKPNVPKKQTNVDDWLNSILDD